MHSSVESRPRASAVLARGRVILMSGLALGCLIFTALVLKAQNWPEVLTNVQATAPTKLVSTAGLIALSFLALTGYDFLAIRLAGYRLPGIGRVLRASFVGFVFSMNFGFTPLSGGVVRAFYYGRAGIPLRGVASILAHMAATFLVGWMGLFGLTLLVWPVQEFTLRFGWADPVQRTLGAVFLLGLAAYFIAAFLGCRLKVGAWSWPLPTFRLALGQIAVGFGDAVVAGWVLYHIFPPFGLSFLPFLGVFLTAVFVGLVSHVPGGLGVIEVCLIHLLGPALSPEQVLAGMVVYRALNFLAPLVLAGTLFAWDAARASRRTDSVPLN